MTITSSSSLSSLSSLSLSSSSSSSRTLKFYLFGWCSRMLFGFWIRFRLRHQFDLFNLQFQFQTHLVFVEISMRTTQTCKQQTHNKQQAKKPPSTSKQLTEPFYIVGKCIARVTRSQFGQLWYCSLSERMYEKYWMTEILFVYPKLKIEPYLELWQPSSAKGELMDCWFLSSCSSLFSLFSYWSPIFRCFLCFSDLLCKLSYKVDLAV